MRMCVCACGCVFVGERFLGGVELKGGGAVIGGGNGDGNDCEQK